jgi:hypothetical protein
MSGIEPNGVALAVFTAAFAACCFAFFTVAGMFPLSARPRALAGLPGMALVVVNLVLLILLLAEVLLYAGQTLRWTSIVIFGGLIFLFVPSIFTIIPNSWRDSRGGLALLGAVQLGAIALLPAPLHLSLS